MIESTDTLVQFIGREAAGAALIAAAAKRAFADVPLTFSEAETVPQAAAQSFSGRRIAVIPIADERQMSEAEAVMDREQLPLWAVVPLEGEAWSLSGNGDQPQAATVAIAASALRRAAAAHQAQRAEIRARGDFLSIASRICHDLCSPLSTVQTAVSLLSTLQDASNSNEVTRLAVSSLRQQQGLIGNLRRFTEAIGGPVEREPLNMEVAFQDGLELTRSVIDESGRAVRAPETWPSDALGDSRYVYFMWEMMLLSLAHSPQAGRELRVGWERADNGARYRFWIQAKAEGHWPQDGIVPFHLLHQYRDNRDLGPPFVLRLAQIQGGSAKLGVVENGLLEFSFTLLRDR